MEIQKVGFFMGIAYDDWRRGCDGIGIKKGSWKPLEMRTDDEIEGTESISFMDIRNQMKKVMMNF